MDILWTVASFAVLHSTVARFIWTIIVFLREEEEEEVTDDSDDDQDEASGKDGSEAKDNGK